MSQDPTWSPTDDGSDRSRAIARLFAEYVDRLNRGEVLAKEEIRGEHPDLAADLIARLTEFEAFADGEQAVAGKSFGGYRIDGELGRGGMGVVYDAFELSMERRVALKVLPAGLKIDASSVERFRREARIAGKLQHPNIVSVFGTGVVENTPFIAMEFVDGESLEKILRRKRPTVATSAAAGEETCDAGDPAAAASTSASEEDSWSGIPSSPEELDLSYSIATARRFAAVADALEHAHERGVVHRDLKPSNLMLDTDGNLRILDFGLARLEGQEHLTGSGQILGTPRYMSPEQARGGNALVDRRTDVYSLGATLYEALTLTPPFVGRSPEDTISAILRREPRPLRQLNPRVPRDLETIVEKCLRKDPAARYASARALADDLEAFARGDPIAARPLTLGERTVRRLRTHWKALAVVAALVVISAFSTYLAVARHRAEEGRRVAEYDARVLEALDRLQMSGAFAEKTSLFTWQLAGYDETGLSRGLEDNGPWSPLDEPIAALARQAAAVPERPDAHYHLARGYSLRGDYERALEALQPAIELGFVPAMALEARLHTWRGDAKRAEETFARVRRAAQDDWPQWWLESSVAIDEDRWADAVAASEKLIELDEQGVRAYLGSDVEAWIHLGIARLQLEHFEEARNAFSVAGALRASAVAPSLFLAATHYLQGDRHRAAEIFEKLHRRVPSDDVAIWIVLLYTVRFQDYTAAEPWARKLADGFFRNLCLSMCLGPLGRVDEMREVVLKLPEQGPDAPVSFIVSAGFLMNSGELEKAEAYLRRAIELAPESSVPYTMLSYVLQARRDYLGTMSMLEKAYTLEPDSAMVNFYLGIARAAAGDRDGGISLLERAIELSGGKSSMNLDLTDVYAALGTHLEQAGRVEEASEAFRHAVEHGRPRGAGVGEAYVGLVRTLRASGSVAAAVRAIEEIVDSREQLGLFAGYETLLRDVAERARPDLPTFRSVELAVERSSREWLIAPGETWRYFKGVGAPSPALEWTAPEFDDTSWLTGESGFGYGDDDDRTVLEDMRAGFTTLYVRHAFTIERALGAERAAVLSLRVDDGFVAYLDGEEIGRRYVGAARIVAHDTVATAVPAEPTAEAQLVLPASRLRAGRHVIAVLGVNARESSDFSLAVDLSAPRPARAEDFERLEEEYAPLAKDAPARARLAYLRGMKLGAEGRPGDASLQFALAQSAAPDADEPLVARVGSMRALGESADAAALLATVLASCPDSARLWSDWIETSLVDLARTPRDLLDGFPCAASPGGDTPGSPAIHRELLETLARREPLRIDCGRRGAARAGWWPDRFFLRGTPESERGGGARVELAPGVEESPYATGRYFAGDTVRGAYAIPLPPGSYDVVLHFAEIWFAGPGERSFDVIVEGDKLREAFDPASGGAGRSVALPWSGEVADGSLEISFRRRRDNPKISGIEVRPAADRAASSGEIPR